MKIAIIDLGTNTFHIVIYETIDQAPGYQEIARKRIYVSLGQDGIATAYIVPEAAARALNAMLEFRAMLDQHQVEKVYAVGTSALRNATNTAELISKIQQKTNISVEIISGQEEASLIYAGVKEAVTMTDETDLVMDIGGGSVEFILCNKNKALWQYSFEIGAQRLADQFHQQDPITPEALFQLDAYLEEKLNPLFEVIDRYQPTQLIGSSGAFAILFLVYAAKEKISIDAGATAAHLPVQKLIEIYHDIRYKTHQERIQVLGMPNQRVDMIVVSTSLIHFVLQRTGIQHLTVSKYALKEGLLFRALETLDVRPVVPRP
jgi:exopolyphosphatase/guanosine-5'-triphosphate,3'-diphosphate pyrophosphatase